MSDAPIEDVVLKSSGDWAIENSVFVMDPDGWDRLHLEESWTELIDEDEFNRRLMQSTIIVISPDPAPTEAPDPDADPVVYPNPGDTTTPTPVDDPTPEPAPDPVPEDDSDASPDA